MVCFEALSRRCREERAMWSQSGVHQIHWSSSGADLVADEELQVMELISREKFVVSATSLSSPEDTSPGPRAQELIGPFFTSLGAERAELHDVYGYNLLIASLRRKKLWRDALQVTVDMCALDLEPYPAFDPGAFR
eukprot:s2059_g4.t1